MRWSIALTDQFVGVWSPHAKRERRDFGSGPRVSPAATTNEMRAVSQGRPKADSRRSSTHNPFVPRNRNLKPSALSRTVRTPLIEPPKYRHSVTAFQGLDLRVTILFVTRESASYLL